MNEREKANQLAKGFDQYLQGSQKPISVEDKEGKDMFSLAKRLHTGMQPGRKQEIQLRQKLDQIAQQATPQFGRQQKRRVFSIKLFNLVGSAALILLIGVGLFWAVQSLNPDPPLPAAAPISSPPLPEVIPASQSLVADACQISRDETGNYHNPEFLDTPDGYIGGGTVESGNFSFTMWLICSQEYQRGASTFKRESEVDGLGVFAYWDYDHKGDDTPGSYTEYGGFEPFVIERGGAGHVINGDISSGFTNGFLPTLGTDISPDFSQQDTRLRLVQYVEFSNGVREGAALSFTLQREASGYRPVNIETSLLTQAEIDEIKNQTTDDLPYAILPPTDSNEPQVEEIIPASQSLVADACQISLEESGLNLNRFYSETTQGFVGGGAVQTGDFTFNIWLACDPQFQRELSQSTNLSQISDIDGLGIFTAWEYDQNAPEMAGSYIEYAGFEPFVKESGEGSPISGGHASATLTGFIPAYGILPDFSQQDTPLRYVQYVELPDGTREGAALTFTLQREPEGYRPIDIQVSLLTQAEIDATKNLSPNDLPFPTFNVVAVMTPMQPIISLMTQWQDTLLETPGWVYQQQFVEDPDGNNMLGGLTNYTQEYWAYINQDGLVDKYITIETAPDGRIIQESAYANGVIQNYTTATDYPYQPHQFDVVRDHINSYLSVTRSGQDLQPQRTSWQGHAAWMLETGSNFDPPITMGNKLAKAILNREYIDAESGQPLGYESILITLEGEETLQQRNYQKIYQPVDTPPENALVLLSRQIGTYQPAPPYGEPAPLNFDPAGQPLYLHSQPGDQMDMPTFWYGDLSAGGYYLGRVDFGQIPGGGWPACTVQGDKLAFLYQIYHSDTDVDSRLRWFNLRDVEQVFAPQPDQQVNSNPAWSPDGNTLAFFACEPDQQDCGLYLLDTTTNTTRLLSTAGHSMWPLLWKPDNRQIAFVDTQTTTHTLFVLDVARGTILEKSLFDAGQWQPPVGSLLNEWGVNFPREYVGTCYAN